MAEDGEQRPPGRPDYKVYRSRPGLLSRLRSPDLSSLRRKEGDKGGGGPKRPSVSRSGRRPPPKREGRPWWKWLLLAALAWLLVSFIAFEVSAQIQRWKLADGVTDHLHGNPFMAASPQTILVLGTDIRSGQFAGPAEAASKHCLEAAGSGEAPPTSCTPYRSDTIMLVRAGGGTFRKLSIPRDTLADIPDHGPQKINSAYAFGGADLTIQTIEGFLGINIDQVAVIDFDGFRKFIDSVGGVNVDVPTKICSSVSGGAFNLYLNPGEHTLDGYQAITLARTRENQPTDKNGNPCPPLSDLDRVRFQQLIIDGIKDRLTDPLRLPYNFIKGPFIGWNAPKVMESSMGAWTMPQLLFSAGIGGGGGTDVLKPSGTTAAGNLVIPQAECVRALTKFLGHSPPQTPPCSPPA